MNPEQTKALPELEKPLACPFCGELPWQGQEYKRTALCLTEGCAMSHQIVLVPEWNTRAGKSLAAACRVEECESEIMQHIDSRIAGHLAINNVGSIIRKHLTDSSEEEERQAYRDGYARCAEVTEKMLDDARDEVRRLMEVLESIRYVFLGNHKLKEIDAALNRKES